MSKPSIEQIKQALKKNPDLINRVDGLREFVENNIEEFQFLYTGSNGNSGRKKGSDTESVKNEPSRRWNPKIVKI